ncbi:MAG TPA: LPS-assembly protein LptD [Gammaproteobacteria bacterium]|nr:LPS-assembly protein LptD [Gammaproteobacteria bacterium]
MRRYFLLLLCFLTVNIAQATDDPALCTAPGLTAATTTDPPNNSPTPKDTTAFNTNWANLLGWVPLSTNLCGGYFYEPAYITAVPSPPPIKSAETTIKSTGLTSFSLTGPSTLEGVTVTQHGREMTADKAILYRDAKTGKINIIDLIGNVHFREAGKLVVGNFSRIDVTNNTLTIINGGYHTSRPSPTVPTEAWGLGSSMFREANGNMQLENATYTTCSPTDPSWHIESKHLTLNKITGRGVARDAWFYIGNQRLLYTPYASFPIDRRRYSGFLFPSVGYNSDSGFIVNIPYYFNLAPNFDDTFTLTGMTLRGTQLTNNFRYLTQNSEGSLLLSFLPYDSEFAQFKAGAEDEFPHAFPRYLSELSNDSTSRGALGFTDKTTFSDKWSGSLDLNYVTDDYYFRDLGNTPEAINNDQLLNEAQIGYQDTHWQFSAMAQAYQTLHLIDQNFVADQYQRLPQLDLNASYPLLPHNLDFEYNSEWTYFDHAVDFVSGKPFPTGNRIHVNPQLKLPITRSWGFFTPALGLDATGYDVANNGVVSSSGILISEDEQPDLNKLRVLPIFDIDSGLYFDRSFHLFQHPYQQTLEPRVLYLYVPYTNQNSIPDFDTSLPTFTTDQLFVTNRFVGYDRVGDANQVAVGLTTRILDDYTGVEKANATLGEIYYFKQPQVCLTPDCSQDPEFGKNVSPVAGTLTYNLTPHVSATASAAYDPAGSGMQNEGLQVNYRPAPQHILVAGYDYVQNGDRLNGVPPDSSENNLQRLNLGIAWPITEKWSAVGNWNYNISHQHPETYFYGLQYDTCCWAVRVVANRALVQEDANGSTDYRTNIYVQFMLKGMGSVGNSAGGDLIKSALPGFIDYFRG